MAYLLSVKKTDLLPLYNEIHAVPKMCAKIPDDTYNCNANVRQSGVALFFLKNEWASTAVEKKRSKHS
jgi:hypothetical protein